MKKSYPSRHLLKEVLKRTIWVCISILLLAPLVTAQGSSPTVAPLFGIGQNGSIEDMVEVVVCGRGMDNSPWGSKVYTDFPDFPNLKWKDMAGTTYDSASLINEGVAFGQCGNGFYLYSRGLDNYLWRSHFCSFAGSDLLYTGNWVKIDNQKQFRSAPAAVTMWRDGDHPGGAAYHAVFVRGTDNAIWYRWLDFSCAWESLGGCTYDSPAVVSPEDGEIYLFIRGTDNAIWYRRMENYGWAAPWVSLGGTVSSAPAAAYIHPDEVSVFVRGMDNHLWWRCLPQENGYPWRRWAQLGPDFVMTSGPSAVGDTATHKRYIFARGAYNSIWYYDMSGTDSWHNLGGTFR
jgi:hypothetical protein